MSAIDVVMDAMGLDFADAVDWLKDKLGIKDPPRLHFVFRKRGEARPVEESAAEWIAPKIRTSWIGSGKAATVIRASQRLRMLRSSIRSAPGALYCA